MADLKGNKTGGRVKGTPNKDNELKAFIKGLISDNQDKLVVEIQQLRGKTYVDSMLALLEYAVPKLSRVDGSLDVSSGGKEIAITYVVPKDK